MHKGEEGVLPFYQQENLDVERQVSGVCTSSFCQFLSE